MQRRAPDVCTRFHFPAKNAGGEKNEAMPAPFQVRARYDCLSVRGLATTQTAQPETPHDTISDVVSLVYLLQNTSLLSVTMADEDGEEARLLQQIDNDELTDVHFILTDANATRFGRAIHGNTIIRKLTLGIENLTDNGDYSLILNFIQCKKLYWLYLISDVAPREADANQASVADRFILAASQKKDTVVLSLANLKVTTRTIALLLRDNDCLRKLSFFNLASDGPLVGQEARDVEIAVRENKTLRGLGLWYCHRRTEYERLLRPILKGLGRNKSVRHLNFFNSFCFAHLTESKQLFESSNGLNLFHFPTMP
jgi:hypothetical protein